MSDADLARTPARDHRSHSGIGTALWLADRAACVLVGGRDAARESTD
jgi:hypothetical protein